MRFSPKVFFRIGCKLASHLGLLGTGVILGAMILAYILAGEIYDYQDTAEVVYPPQVDAIVCLAGGRGRVVAAGDLWYRYWELSHSSTSSIEKTPILYFAGMGHQVNWSSVSKQLKRKVVDVIRPEDVVVENESTNTDSNARWLVTYVQKFHWKKVLLLTSSYHMKRARFIFDHVLKIRKTPIDIKIISVYQEPFTAQEWRTGPNGIRVTLMEYLKGVYYKSIWSSF